MDQEDKITSAMAAGLFTDTEVPAATCTSAPAVNTSTSAIVSVEEKLIEKQDEEGERAWQPYTDKEFIGTYVPLPPFVKKFRGKFQAIFGRRFYAFSRFSMSIGEVLFFLGSIVIMGGNIYTNYGQNRPSGDAASIPLLGCLIFTVKNSILGYIVGISYERGIFWHKLFGVIAIVGGIMHLLSSLTQQVIDGWILLGSMFSMIVFSFWPIRIYFHAAFMKLHWIGFVVFMVGTVWHGVTLGIIGAGYYAADFLVKLLVIDRHRKNQAEAEIVKMSNDILRIRVKNSTIPFQGGQFMLVCIPKVSYFEWHPFSVQTSFKEGRIDLFVKASGSWTLDLLAFVNEAGGDDRKHIDNTRAAIGQSVTTRVYLSGPFGFPSIDIEGDRYKSYFLVGGGIGITPIISTCKALLEQKMRGRPVSKIVLLWTTRDMVAAEELISFEYLESLLSSDSDRNEKVLEVFCHCSAAKAPAERKQSEAEEEEHSGNGNQKVKLSGSGGIARSEIATILTKRPDVGEYLKKFKSDAIARGEKRAAVMVCGPHQLIIAVQSHASKVSNRKLRFDVHEEVFAM